MNENLNGKFIIWVVLAAILTTFASGIFFGFGFLALGITIRFPEPLVLLGLGWSLGVIFTWYLILRKGFYVIERIFHVDINGDGIEGDPKGNNPTEPEAEPSREIKIWVPHDENQGHDLKTVVTPRDETLANMAVILTRQGWDYFTQDNFTTTEKGTRLMSRRYWDEKFIPAMVAARLAEFTGVDSAGRKKVRLTKKGQDMFTVVFNSIGTKDTPLPY